VTVGRAACGSPYAALCFLPCQWSQSDKLTGPVRRAAWLVESDLPAPLTPNSRSSLNRWASPDTVIPDYYNPLDFDRYQYVRSNPLKYVDPSGHMQICADGDEGGGCGQGANLNQVYDRFAKYGNHRGLFAEYYTKLYNFNKIAYDLYNRMFPNGVLDSDDYNLYLNTLQPYSQDLALTYSVALNYLPQKNFNPASAASGFVVGIGKGVMSWLSSGVIASSTIFVSTPSGTLVPVPEGWQPSPTTKNNGIIYQAPGSVRNANSIRIMDPGVDPRYPQGYVRGYNGANQPMTVNGTPGSPADTHIDVTYQGPITGWPR